MKTYYIYDRITPSSSYNKKNVSDKGCRENKNTVYIQ